MLVRYPPSEIQAELLPDMSMDVLIQNLQSSCFQLRVLLSPRCSVECCSKCSAESCSRCREECCSGWRSECCPSWWSECSSNCFPGTVFSARRIGGSANCALECWCTRQRIWGEYSCPGSLVYIYVVMNCGRGFARVHFVGWIVQVEKPARGLRMLVWVQIVLNCGRVFAGQRTMTPCLSSNCFELWARFRRSAFCRMNRSGGKACSRTTNACLSSNCFELWASFCQSKDFNDSLFEFKLFLNCGPDFAGVHFVGCIVQARFCRQVLYVVSKCERGFGDSFPLWKELNVFGIVQSWAYEVCSPYFSDIVLCVSLLVNWD